MYSPEAVMKHALQPGCSHWYSFPFSVCSTWWRRSASFDANRLPHPLSGQAYGSTPSSTGGSGLRGRTAPGSIWRG